MYSSTGLSSEQITDLVARIHDLREAPASRAGRKPTLGLYKCVVVALIYLRSNRTQASIADQFHVSQKTISRTIASWMPILGQALQDCTPTVDDLDVSEPLIVDGTLLPTWSWRTMPELYSGKHKTTGVNVQVACDLTGRLAFISDPMPGRTHDAHALKETGLLDHITTGQLIGDKGYIGLGMITPIRTQPKQQHTEEEKRFNKSVNAIRYMIERVIANLKTWRVLHTGHRRPLHTFPRNHHGHHRPRILQKQFCITLHVCCARIRCSAGRANVLALPCMAAWWSAVFGRRGRTDCG